MTNVEKEKVILAGCQLTDDTEQFLYSMQELKSLTETAQGESLAMITQKESESTQAHILAKER